MTLPIAIRQLRDAADLSQQAFADRVRLSIRAIANYEKDRTPDARALFRFANLASEVNRPDLARFFSEAIQREIGGAAVSIADELHRSALIAVYENRSPEWLERELVYLIAEARAGNPLAYPTITDDGVLDQSMRIRHLESLLVNLRMRRPGTAHQLLDSMAAERAKQTGETAERASWGILMDHPNLYSRYNQERADAARGTQFESSLAVYGTRQHAEAQKAKKSKRSPKK